MSPCLREADAGTALAVHVQPGASRPGFAGLHGEALKIRLSARAVEGAANQALLEFLAQSLGVPRRAVRIAHGEKSRHKVVSVELPIAQVAAWLAERCKDEGGAEA